MSKIPIFLFAFANDDKQSLKLKDEENLIRSLIDPLHDQKRVEVHYLSNATVDQIYHAFNRFHQRIALFHYSGHSGRSFLSLDDKEARASFLATLMGMQKKLKLVFLNGCSNYQQVAVLNEQGVQNIIATSVAIEDLKAIAFSKYFYQAFTNNSGLSEAFDLAKARLQNDYPALSIEKRDIVFGFKEDGQPNEEKQFPWGLYGINEEKLNWQLPQAVQRKLIDTEEVQLNYPDVNKELVELAFEGMSKYGADYEVLWNMYQRDTSPRLFNTLQNMMLDSFPTSVGIQLRDLFTPEGKTKGRLRLRQINETYLTACKLLCSISMANLWDKVIDKETFLPKENFTIRSDYKMELEKYLNLTAEQAASFDYIWLIATISNIFKDNNITPFITEFQDLSQSLISFDEVYEAYRFFEQDLRNRLLANDVDTSEVEDLCHLSEGHLGIIIKKCAFLCAYQLVTIKDIGVSKSRRTKEPSFIHSKSILKGRDYATIDDKPVARSSFTSNNSVVVTKDIQTSLEQLNLSPFVIDENAFKLQEEKLPKIHYFKGFSNDNTILYEHAELLEEDFKVMTDYNVKKYKDLGILIEQLEQLKSDLRI